MSHKQDFEVILRDGDGQPLTSYTEYGMADVRERIKIARDDWAHYPALQFIVKNESGEVVIDRTYRSKPARRVCADCGQHGEITGHMGCMYPGLRVPS